MRAGGEQRAVLAARGLALGAVPTTTGGAGRRRRGAWRGRERARRHARAGRCARRPRGARRRRRGASGGQRPVDVQVLDRRQHRRRCARPRSRPARIGASPLIRRISCPARGSRDGTARVDTAAPRSAAGSAATRAAAEARLPARCPDSATTLPQYDRAGAVEGGRVTRLERRQDAAAVERPAEEAHVGGAAGAAGDRGSGRRMRSSAHGRRCGAPARARRARRANGERDGPRPRHVARRGRREPSPPSRNARSALTRGARRAFPLAAPTPAWSGPRTANAVPAASVASERPRGRRRAEATLAPERAHRADVRNGCGDGGGAQRPASACSHTACFASVPGAEAVQQRDRPARLCPSSGQVRPRPAARGAPRTTLVTTRGDGACRARAPRTRARAAGRDEASGTTASSARRWGERVEDTR